MLRKNLSLLFTLLSVALSAKADPTVTSKNTVLPDAPRVLFSAAATNIGIFGGDAMLPLMGNKNQFIYADMMGDYGTNDTYLLSPGGGYRGIVSNQIVGAYFFADYEKTDLGANFWVMSPGIEWMNAHWDAHLNGYFPTETKKQAGDQVFASSLGYDDYVVFEDNTHNQYDMLVTPYSVIGNGADAEIGYSFASFKNLRSRAYLGMYYYQPPASDGVDDIGGVTGGFEQPLTENLSLALFNSYDQVSNYTVGVSLTATFGQDSTVFSNNIHDRMLDPVQRHVGIIGTGAGTYDQQSLQADDMALQYDNVYFLAPHTQGNGDGTYGNAAELTQATLDTTNQESPDGARFYLQGGTDGVYEINSTTAPDQIPSLYGEYGLSVYNNQNFYGRTADYTAAAESDAQPQIEVDGLNYSGFVMTDTENTFSDLTIYGGPSTSYGEGFNVYDNSTLTLNNVNISGMGTGVSAENTSDDTLTVNVSHSTINDNEGNGIAFLNNFQYGTMGDGVLNMSDSQINNNISGVAAENDADGTLSMNIENTIITGNDQNGVFAGNNLYTRGTGSGVFTVNITNSSIDGNGIPNLGSNVGLLSNNPGTLTFTAINTTMNDGYVGLSVINMGPSNSIINVSDLSGSSISNNTNAGIYAQATAAGSSTTINYTGATIDGNGTDLVDASFNSGVITWIPTAPQ